MSLQISILTRGATGRPRCFVPPTLRSLRVGSGAGTAVSPMRPRRGHGSVGAMTITIENLTRTYGAYTAVNDVSFTAAPGRVTGFLGPNGAGKSTTMRVLVGLTAPTAGTATILGRSFRDLPNPGREVGV